MYRVNDYLLEIVYWFFKTESEGNYFITKKFAPIAHSTVLKEEYSNIEIVLKKIKYEDHKWLICGDLKILSMILGQQSDFTKYPCFLCGIAGIGKVITKKQADHWKKVITTKT